MLACSTLPDINLIKYPKYCSNKLDGIRCLIVNGKALSRSLKPIPNLHIQKTLAKFDLDGCDGELMVNGDFNDVQSAVMSVHGTPDFTYQVFDFVDTSLKFNDRITQALHKVYSCKSDKVKFLAQHKVESADDVALRYALATAAGDEGLILKDINGLYKFGRSTLKQETMLKLKQIIDDEAIVVGFTELQHNNNDAYLDEVGNQVRSDHKAFKEGGGTLGALVVKYGMHTFNIGSGFDLKQRQTIWDDKEKYRNEPVKFKHLGLSKYGVPRCPIYLTFRHRDDM